MVAVALNLTVTPGVARLGARASSSEISIPQKRTYVFIVNPKAGSGKSFKKWEEMKPLLQTSLGEEITVREALTEYPYHAAELAREAVEQGAEAVVAVGGDGTLHEVVNGFFSNGQPVVPRAAVAQQALRTGDEVQLSEELREQQAAAHMEPSNGDTQRDSERNGSEPTEVASRRPALGVIPLGTGTDFARTFGWRSNDVKASVARIVRGQRRAMDVGRVQLPACAVDRCFINVADVHLSARVGRAAVSLKALGPLCYAVAAFKAFPKHRNLDLSIRRDNGPWETLPAVTTIAIGNANYYGGGMKICPHASPSSGSLDVVTVCGYTVLGFILRGLHLFSGTHLGFKGVDNYSAEVIEMKVAAAEGDNNEASQVYVEGDGEALGHLPAVFRVLPGAIDLLV